MIPSISLQESRIFLLAVGESRSSHEVRDCPSAFFVTDSEVFSLRTSNSSHSQLYIATTASLRRTLLGPCDPLPSWYLQWLGF